MLQHFFHSQFLDVPHICAVLLVVTSSTTASTEIDAPKQLSSLARHLTTTICFGSSLRIHYGLDRDFCAAYEGLTAALAAIPPLSALSSSPWWRDLLSCCCATSLSPHVEHMIDLLRLAMNDRCDGLSHATGDDKDVMDELLEYRDADGNALSQSEVLYCLFMFLMYVFL